jgi:hypothetical protein
MIEEQTCEMEVADRVAEDKEVLAVAEAEEMKAAKIRTSSILLELEERLPLQDPCPLLLLDLPAQHKHQFRHLHLQQISLHQFQSVILPPLTTPS